jgi:hypothetical protein
MTARRPDLSQAFARARKMLGPGDEIEPFAVGRQMADSMMAQVANAISRLIETETQRAYTDTKTAGMQHVEEVSDRQVLKIWDAEADACDVCAEQDGISIPLDESFALDGPPAHPWCRCLIGTIFADEP